MNKKMIIIILGILILLVGSLFTFRIEGGINFELLPATLSGFVSAAGEEEKITKFPNNYSKNYTSSTERVLIKDDKNNTLLDSKLLTPRVFRVHGGIDVKIAEVNLIDYFDGDMDVFDKVDFLDLHDNNETMGNTYTWKYKATFLSEDCDPNCTFRNQTNWTEFTKLGELPSKNTTIGLFTDTKAGQTFEWIPWFQNISIPEWATVVVENITYIINTTQADATVLHNYSMVNGNSDADRMLFVFVAAPDVFIEDGITYNGVAGTQLEADETGTAGFIGSFFFSWNDSSLPTDTDSHQFNSTWNAAPTDISLMVRELSGATQDSSPNRNFTRDKDKSNQTVILTTLENASNVYLMHIWAENRNIVAQPPDAELSDDDAPGSFDGTFAHNITGLTPNGSRTYFWTLDSEAARATVAFEIIDAPSADTPPQWSLNSTNSTVAGTFILHTVRWTDDTALSGYIFEFDNGTSGGLTNDSFVLFTGTSNHSNVTKTVNTTVGATISWRVYSNDSANQLNSTDLFTYNTTAAGDVTPPTFITIPANVSGDYLVANVNAVFDYTDDVAISMIIVNDTSNFTMNNATKTLTNNSALAAGFYSLNVTINDSSNNLNWTIFTVTINQIVPQGTLAGTSPITHPTAGDVEGSESNTGDGDVTYTLFRNGTSVSNPDTSVLAVNFYSYIFNTTGGENYTLNASMDTFNLTINQNVSTCQVFFNETSPLTYPSTFLVSTDCSSAFTLTRNGTAISNNSQQINGVGAFNFSVQRTDTENYTNTFDDEQFIINQATPALALAVTNVTYPSNGIINASETNTGDGDATYSLFINGSLETTGSTIDLLKDFSASNYQVIYNTSGGLNYTSASTQLEMEILVGNLTGTIAGTSPITYPTVGDVEGTESNTGDGDVTYTLYRNGTAVSNPDASTLAVNFYSYIYNATAGENYTVNTSMDTFDLTINQNTELVFTLFNTTSPVTYPETFLVFSNITSAFTLLRNGTSISNNSEQALAAGIYNFTTIRTDNENYTNVFNETTFVVDQGTPVITKLLNNAASNISVVYPTGINASGQSTGGTITIYRNGTQISNNLNTTLAVNHYEYRFNVTGNENFTSLPTGEFLFGTVTLSQDSCIVNFNETSPLTYPSTFNVSTDCTSAFTLTINGTTISNNTEQDNGIGAFNFSVQRTDTENYTNTVNESQFIINQNTELVFTLFNTTSPVTYPETFLVFSNASSTFTIFRNGTSVANNSEQALAAGIYNFTTVRTDNVNYSSFFNETTFVVDQGTGEVFAFINNVRANRTVTIFDEEFLNATLNVGTGDIQLFYNDSLINEGASPLSNLTNFTEIGVFNVSGIYSGNENFTSDIETFFVNVTAVSEITLTNVINHTVTVNTSFSYDINASGGTIDTFTLNDTSIFIINSSTGVVTNGTALINITLYVLNVTVNNTVGNSDSEVFFIDVITDTTTLKWDWAALMTDLISPDQICFLFRGSGEYCIDSGTMTGRWNLSGINLFPSDLSSNVGIGTTTPQNTLNVVGDLNATGDITTGGNVTLFNGGILWGNTTCTFVSSPAGTTRLEVCD